MRLLVVEDDEQLAKLLAQGLTSAGFAIDLVTAVAEAQARLLVVHYAALVLDLGLPDGDGLLVLRDLRHRGNSIPVLLLTARGGINERVRGLRSGADDYLVKPFALEELVARLEALLRRPGQLLGNALSLGNVVFDTSTREILVGGVPKALSSREAMVLELLLRRKGGIVPKRFVEDQLFGLSGDLASNAVEVYVHRLRKQLLECGAQIKIHTIRGVGYQISGEQ